MRNGKPRRRNNPAAISANQNEGKKNETSERKKQLITSRLPVPEFNFGFISKKE